MDILAKHMIQNLFGFESLKETKEYLIKHAKEEYGCKSCEIKKKGYTLRYSSNCKPSNRFGIGSNIKGSFMEITF